MPIVIALPRTAFMSAFLLLGAAAQGDADPCRAASAVERTVPVGTPPAVLVARQKAYRAAWLAACSDARGAPTIATLHGEAGRLAAVYEKWVADIDPGDKAEALQAFLTEMSGFVPALEGNYSEAVFVRLRGADFRALAEKRGTPDDKAALEALLRTTGDAPWPAWVQMTWDLGGCTRFGDHDWVGALSAADAVRTRAAAWKPPIDAAITDMLAVVAPPEPSDICTCGPIAAVAADLAKLDIYLAKTPGYARARSRTQALATAVKIGKVKVRSEAVAHCSGG